MLLFLALIALASFVAGEYCPECSRTVCPPGWNCRNLFPWEQENGFISVSYYYVEYLYFQPNVLSCLCGDSEGIYEQYKYGDFVPSWFPSDTCFRSRTTCTWSSPQTCPSANVLLNQSTPVSTWSCPEGWDCDFRDVPRVLVPDSVVLPSSGGAICTYVDAGVLGARLSQNPVITNVPVSGEWQSENQAVQGDANESNWLPGTPPTPQPAGEYCPECPSSRTECPPGWVCSEISVTAGEGFFTAYVTSSNLVMSCVCVNSVGGFLLEKTGVFVRSWWPSSRCFGSRTTCTWYTPQTCPSADVLLNQSAPVSAWSCPEGWDCDFRDAPRVLVPDSVVLPCSGGAICDYFDEGVLGARLSQNPVVINVPVSGEWKSETLGAANSTWVPGTQNCTGAPVPIPPPQPSCTEDADCPRGQTCIGSTCLQAEGGEANALALAATIALF